MEHIRANMPVGDQPAEITRFVVRTFAKGLGRGPTKARAYVMGDLVTVLLRETFTRPERVLYEHGQFEALGVARAAMQRILREPLSSGVELATGKTVAHCTSTTRSSRTSWPSTSSWQRPTMPPTNC